MIPRIVLVQASNIYVVDDAPTMGIGPEWASYSDTHPAEEFSLSASALTAVFAEMWDRSAMVGFNRDAFRRLFLSSPQPHEIAPNPLRILSRAVNCVRLCRPIRIPCWRRGRWKSLT